MSTVIKLEKNKLFQANLVLPKTHYERIKIGKLIFITPISFNFIQKNLSSESVIT